MRKIYALTRENAQLKALIAEQKNYPHVNDYIAQQYAEIQRLRGIVCEQKDVIEKQQDMFDEWQLHCQDLVCNCTEQSALIEKLGSYLRKAAKAYSRSHCEMICDEALAELAAWKSNVIQPDPA